MQKNIVANELTFLLIKCKKYNAAPMKMFCRKNLQNLQDIFKKIILSHKYGKYFGNNDTSVFKPPT